MEQFDNRSHQYYQVVPKYERSDRIGSRRKALFPTESEDSNSDLGPMSPLSDNSPDSNVSFKNLFPSNTNCPDDYQILDDSFDDLQHEESIDLSHNTTNFDTPCSAVLNLTTGESPPSTVKKSPSSNLKTPHDSTNNSKLPRLSRKVHENDEMETNESEETNDRKQSIETNASRMSKVRTALFPEVLPLSTKSFYPKTLEKKPERLNRSYNAEVQKPKTKARVLYLCNRISRRRNREGQINNGVRHKIRKPKTRKVTKLPLKKAAMSETQGSQIMEYIQDLNNLNTSAPKQIQPLKTITSPRTIEGNKENTVKQENVEKKFFKNVSRKLITEDDKITLEKEKTKAANDLLDLLKEFNNDSPPLDLKNIIHDLDEEISPAKTILTASNKVTDSYDSIMSHSTVDKPQSTYKDRKRKLDEPVQNIAETLLSPTSQMCDMASGLAIRSPKRARLNINNILENDDLVEKQLGNVFNDMSSSSVMENRKLYPVFYKENRMKNKEAPSAARPTSAKKFKVSADQMLLDAGQKMLGVTQCYECDIVYSRGDPDDEANHLNYHNAVHILKFQGWKNERIVGAHCGNRIIKIVPDDSKIWLKKIKDLLEVINRDLGFVEQSLDMDNYVYYLYIKDKRIAGCLVAELKTTGFKMLSSVDGIDLCSEESYPIKCGISRIWVSQRYRKQRIASAMMDCLRKNFMFGYVLKLEEIGMSTPTDLGKLFAAKYFQTPNYLIYTS